MKSKSIQWSFPFRNLSAVLCCCDTGEPVIFWTLCLKEEISAQKMCLGSFKVCWHKFSQASRLRELRGTEQSAFSPPYSGGTQCWEGVQLPNCGSNTDIPGSGERKGFYPGLQHWVSLPSFCICSLKGVGVHLYVQSWIFSLLSTPKSSSATVFLRQNSKTSLKFQGERPQTELKAKYCCWKLESS